MRRASDFLIRSVRATEDAEMPGSSSRSTSTRRTSRTRSARGRLTAGLRETLGHRRWMIVERVRAPVPAGRRVARAPDVSGRPAARAAKGEPVAALGPARLSASATYGPLPCLATADRRC